MPQVSIIVPVYKVEPYIRRCLDSILAQTFTDWECILVDDGSPDDCGVICDEYAAKDSRFKVIHQENQGASVARNSALECVKGDYILFIDSDDVIGTPDTIEKNMLHFSRDVDIVQFPIHKVSGAVVEKLCVGGDILIRTEEQYLANYAPFTRKTLIDKSACNKIYRKKVFFKKNFSPGAYHEDAFINLSISSTFYKIFISNDGFYEYRIREGSRNTSTHSSKWISDYTKLVIESIRTVRKYQSLALIAVENYVYALRMLKFYSCCLPLDVLHELLEELESVVPSFFSVLSCCFKSPRNSIMVIFSKILGNKKFVV